MDAFDLKTSTADNEFFRRVISTSKHQQLVMMTIEKNQEIGNEVHPNNDQFIYVVEGLCYAVINTKGSEERIDLRPGYSITIFSGTYHNIIAITKTKLFTVYSPPLHAPDTITFRLPTDIE